MAPAAGWLAHESCTASGELFVAVAGRMAKAWVSETRGVYQPQWSADEVAARIGEIGDRSDPLVFSPLPKGFYDHLGASFAMAKGDSEA